jgi:hypothetical protein
VVVFKHYWVIREIKIKEDEVGGASRTIGAIIHTRGILVRKPEDRRPLEGMSGGRMRWCGLDVAGPEYSQLAGS